MNNQSTNDNFFKKGIVNNEWGVIINPFAGGKAARRKWRLISQELMRREISYHEYFTEYKLHATQLVEELINDGYNNIIVVGGDGSINEVANGIMNQTLIPISDITLAVIPAGKGNDWGRFYKLDEDYNNSISVITGWKTLMQDVGLIEYYKNGKTEQRYFVNMADIGFGVEVVKKANKRIIKGNNAKFTYLYSLFAELLKYKKFPVKITVDNAKEYYVNLFTLFVGIGKFNGGGMQPAPNAITNNGLFEITIINDISVKEVVKSIKKLYDGSINSHKNVISLRGKTITVEAEKKFLIEADGEILGEGPVKFSIIPNALQIISGK